MKISIATLAVLLLSSLAHAYELAPGAKMPEPTKFIKKLCDQAGFYWDKASAIETKLCADPFVIINHDDSNIVKKECSTVQSRAWRAKADALKDWAERLYSGDEDEKIDLCL